jgi:phosphatidylglycerol:prolipoprotein diacylglycerol transferase
VFPYFDSDHWLVRPFAVLVVTAIAVGYLIGLRRFQRQGISRESVSELTLFVMLGGLLGAHLFKFVYSPSAFLATLRHPAELLKIGNGLASFGAFAGGVTGGLVYFRRHSIPIKDWFVYSDTGAFAVPFAWSIGRLGCYLVHDHPGLHTDSWFGVRYPGGNRYDLGLLEMLFLLLLGCTFLLLDNRKWPRGFYCTAFLLCYGVFRWNLDLLHIDPPRYSGWSVDQIASSAMILAGIACIFEMRRLRGRRHASE